MDKEQVRQTIERIQATEEQKERMLKQILKQGRQEKGTRRLLQESYKQWSYVAAFFIAVIGIGVFTAHQREHLPLYYKEAPQMGAEGQGSTNVRQVVHLNGYRYIPLATEGEVKTDKLVDCLGVLENKLYFDGADDLTQDLATTFAVGGEVWAYMDYHPSYRIVVHYDGRYYLCENVGHIDDSYFNIERYFQDAGFEQRIKRAELVYNNGNGLPILLNLSESRTVIRELAQSTFVAPSAIDYERLFEEEIVYFMGFLDDGTYLHVTLIPNMGIMQLGDNYYAITEKLQKRF